MSNPIGATLHGKALLAFGFDLASLRRSMELPGARWFLSGFYPSARGPRHVGAECLASPGSVQLWPPWADASMGNALGYDKMEWKYLPGTPPSPRQRLVT